MNILAAVLTIGIISGLGLLLYGAFFQKGDTAKGTDDLDEEALDKVRLSLEEADTTLSNINSVSSLIIEEIDIKHKELLFLYQMLEEKKQELLEYRNERKFIEEDAVYNDRHYNDRYSENGPVYGENRKELASAFSVNMEIMQISREIDEIRKSPKFRNHEAILELNSRGFSITAIAKELGIGKGEVELVLGLNRVGAGYD